MESILGLLGVIVGIFVFIYVWSNNIIVISSLMDIVIIFSGCVIISGVGLLLIFKLFGWLFKIAFGLVFFLIRIAILIAVIVVIVKLIKKILNK